MAEKCLYTSLPYYKKQVNFFSKNCNPLIKHLVETGTSTIFMNTNSESAYVFFEGYLREIVGEVNDKLIIDNGNAYTLIPNHNYPIFKLKDFFPAEK